MILACSPASLNEAITLSTLRFGEMGSQVRNTVKVNREYTVPELQDLHRRANERAQLLGHKIRAYERVMVENGTEIPDQAKLSAIIK